MPCCLLLAWLSCTHCGSMVLCCKCGSGVSCGILVCGLLCVVLIRCCPVHIPFFFSAGGGGSGGHSVLASAMEPATLAHTYITGRGTFKPAPQPPRKTPTAPKNPKLPDFACLTEWEAEAQLLQTLAGYGCNVIEGEQSERENGSGVVTDEEVGMVLQQWFKEQKRFQENVALRRQHKRLSKQLAQLRKHLAGTGAKAGATRAKAESMQDKVQRRTQLASS